MNDPQRPSHDLNPTSSASAALLQYLLFALGLVWMTAAAAYPASAQIPSWGVDEFKAPADASWTLRTVNDVDAAYRFTLENHAGAAPDLHDDAFIARLDSAHATALKRARLVVSAQGYNAVLAGFATDLGDKHIWSRPTLVLNLPYWAGAMIGKQGDSWVVVASDQMAGSPPIGARLLSCDGIDATTLAERNLGGFRADWRIDAQQYQAAPWLLVDEGNPFVRRPDSCIFATSQGNATLKLAWKRIKREELIPKIKASGGGGAAGFGIRKVGQGYWISLQDESERGAAVATQVEAQEATIRLAPWVVVDVRGNGCGSSDVGARIARQLWGGDRVAAVEGHDDENCGDDLRASPGNVADMEFLLKALDTVLSPEARANLQEQVVLGNLALAQGKAFVRPPTCDGTRSVSAATSSPDRSLKARANRPQIVLLTDNLCFSACLVLADDFRRLGALHVGQTTDAATHFTEVREQYLPSGYSLFSTLQAVAPGEPAQVGPFRPEIMYRGDIADTKRVEQWVVEQINARAGKVTGL